MCSFDIVLSIEGRLLIVVPRQEKEQGVLLFKGSGQLFIADDVDKASVKKRELHEWRRQCLYSGSSAVSPMPSPA